MRKLASIQKIKDIQPIPDADRIEVLTILGWHVVSQKRPDRKVGDLVVYFEIDSKMPEVPWFEDLRPYGHRIKTIRLKGQVSQGYAVPLDILQNVGSFDIDDYHTFRWSGGSIEIEEGEDLTHVLGITKYEPPVPQSLDGTAKGGFPGWISKTDEERIQAFPQLLERYNGTEFLMTEKLDGTSCTVFVDMHDNSFNVCGRQWNLLEDNKNSLWRAIRNGDVEKKLRLMNGQEEFYCLQGEVIGPGIQGNKYALKDVEFRVFNIFNMKDSRHLTAQETGELAERIGLLTVPRTGSLTLQYTVDELVAMAERKSLLNDKIHCEGIVLRPMKEMHDPDVGRLSFKVINPKFLLKYEDA